MFVKFSFFKIFGFLKIGIEMEICFVVTYKCKRWVKKIINSLYYILYFVNIVYYVLCVYCLYLRGIL